MYKGTYPILSPAESVTSAVMREVNIKDNWAIANAYYYGIDLLGVKQILLTKYLTRTLPIKYVFCREVNRKTLH
jgi:hypothetical protein